MLSVLNPNNGFDLIGKQPFTQPLFEQPKPKRREVSFDEIRQKIDKETLFLFAFVPFVITEVAWDYADTCLNLAALLRVRELKPLCRRIRELRSEYDRKRAALDLEHRQIEQENMEAFQEDYKVYFTQLHLNILSKVGESLSEARSEYRMLVSAAYSCRVVLRAMFRYVGVISKRIADMLGVEDIGSIILGELRELERIVVLFAPENSGDAGKNPPDLEVFVDTLVNYLLASEMVDLPCPGD